MKDMLELKRPGIDSKIYYRFNECFLANKEQTSWRGRTEYGTALRKSEKEALNLLVFFVLMKDMAPDIDLRGFISFAALRLITKAYGWDMKPNNKRFFIEAAEDFEESLEEYAIKQFGKNGCEEFAKWLQVDAQRFSPEGVRFYRAARAIATRIEFDAIDPRAFQPGAYEETKAEIVDSLSKYMDYPNYYKVVEGVAENEGLKRLIRSTSFARHTVRWEKYVREIKCSILSHMYESAIISWLHNLENGEQNEEVILHDFEVMLFHDLVEVWADDIPSPAKDGVTLRRKSNGEIVTLRKLSEEQEGPVLEEKFFIPHMSEENKDFLHSIMLGDPVNDVKHSFYKNADYFSADMEVLWQLKASVKDELYVKILVYSYLNRIRSSEQKKCIKYFFIDLARWGEPWAKKIVSLMQKGDEASLKDYVDKWAAPPWEIEE